MEVKNIKACTNCGAELDGKSQFCAGCGSKQEEPKPAVSEVTEKFCAACGNKIIIGQSFCAGCGAKVE